MRCTVQLGPPQNDIISVHSVPAVPATQVTFQCDNGLFPEGILTATCLATGEWDKNPGEIICRGKFIFITCIHVSTLIWSHLYSSTSHFIHLLLPVTGDSYV